jgi:hypothetical protein
MDLVADPLLLRKSGSSWNRTRDLCICHQELSPLDHRPSVVAANAVLSSLITFTLIMETIHSSETPVLTKATRRHIPDHEMLNRVYCSCNFVASCSSWKFPDKEHSGHKRERVMPSRGETCPECSNGIRGKVRNTNKSLTYTANCMCVRSKVTLCQIH